MIPLVEMTKSRAELPVGLDTGEELFLIGPMEEQKKVPHRPEKCHLHESVYMLL
jgi:hypothetical protein